MLGWIRSIHSEKVGFDFMSASLGAFSTDDCRDLDFISRQGELRESWIGWKAGWSQGKTRDEAEVGYAQEFMSVGRC
jgi:hypothetical protein